MTVTPFAPMIEYFFKKPEKRGEKKKVANVSDLEEGSTTIVFFPGEETEDRTFLVHLTPEEVDQAISEGRDEFITEGFVAFNSICPHLQCPVGPPEGTPEEEEFVCPCHGPLVAGRGSHLRRRLRASSPEFAVKQGGESHEPIPGQ